MFSHQNDFLSKHWIPHMVRYEIESDMLTFNRRSDLWGIMLGRAGDEEPSDMWASDHFTIITHTHTHRERERHWERSERSPRPLTKQLFLPPKGQVQRSEPWQDGPGYAMARVSIGLHTSQREGHSETPMRVGQEGTLSLCDDHHCWDCGGDNKWAFVPHWQWFHWQLSHLLILNGPTFCGRPKGLVSLVLVRQCLTLVHRWQCWLTLWAELSNLKNV